MLEPALRPLAVSFPEALRESVEQMNSRQPLSNALDAAARKLSPPTAKALDQELTREEQVRRIIRWTLGLAAIVLFAYGPVPAKAIVLALAAIVLPWWFFRAFLDR